MRGWAALWRDPRRAGLLMWAFFLIALAVGPAIYFNVTVSSGNGPAGPPGWLYGAAFSAFFAWRVTSGGRVSRMLLIIATGGTYLGTASMIAHHFTPVTFGRLLALAAQIALLVSPAVYLRTRPAGQDAAVQAARTRVLPPFALLLLGVLAGLCVTVFGLTSISNPLAVPGCDRGAAPPVLCGTVGEGTPLPWVTFYHGTQVVHWAAMARDWTQFAVIGASVLYAGWLATGARRERPAARWFPADAVVGSALAGLTLTVLTGGIPLRWLSVRQYGPLHNATPLLIDAVLWTLVGLCGHLAVHLRSRWRGRLQAGPSTRAEAQR
jgi:hypothetical protein